MILEISNKSNLITDKLNVMKGKQCFERLFERLGCLSHTIMGLLKKILSPFQCNWGILCVATEHLLGFIGFHLFSEN
jgi:hypothetical protein